MNKLTERMLKSRVFDELTVPVLYLGQPREIPLLPKLRVKIIIRGFIEFGRVLDVDSKRGRVHVSLDDSHPRWLPVSDIFAVKPDEAQGRHDWLIHQRSLRRA